MKKSNIGTPQEQKAFAFDITNVDMTGRTVEGYGAAFGNVDAYGDVIHKGAFTKTISERGQKVKFLYQHDTEMVLGRIVELREDDRGLFVKAIVSDTQLGRDVLALLKDGALDGLSIGYDVIKGGLDYTENKDGSVTRNLREIRLWEISLVTFPANEAATVVALKAAADAPSYGPSIMGDPRVCALCKHYQPMTPTTGTCVLYAFEAEMGYRCEMFAHQAVVAAASHEPQRDAKKAMPPQRFPFADRDMEWNAADAVVRLREWAGGVVFDDIDKAMYRKGFLWYDDAEETFAAYKLPYVDIIDGEPHIIPRAVFAVAGALSGARGGVDIPDADAAAVKRGVNSLYARLAQELEDDTIVPPWKAKASNEHEFVTITLPASILADAIVKALGGTAATNDAAEGVLHELRNLSYNITEPSLKEPVGQKAAPPIPARTERTDELLKTIAKSVVEIEEKELGNEA